MKQTAIVLLLTACVAALGAQTVLPPPFPRQNATKLLDTDRINVWDVAWPKGQPTALHRHVYDQVGTYYAPGGRVITPPAGAARTIDTPVGALSNTRKGTTHVEEGTTDPPLRAVFIELKADAATGLPAAEVGGLPAFPRADATRALDNDRVTAWDFVWVGGADGLRFRAARETVIVWLGVGTIRVTPGRGPATPIEVKAGTMRHVPRGSEETIEMVSGSPRTMLFELK